MNKPKVLVVLGSIRDVRAGQDVANWFLTHVKNRDDAEYEFVDVKELNLPLFASDSPKNKLSDLPQVQSWAQKVKGADAFIFITPEYNHGYSSALKNAIDYLYWEWNNKPVAFVGYGTLGGARSVEQLRQVAVELQMAPIREAVHITIVWEAFDKEGKLKSELAPIYDKQAELLLNQLQWWTKALKTARESQ